MSLSSNRVSREHSEAAPTRAGGHHEGKTETRTGYVAKHLGQFMVAILGARGLLHCLSALRIGIGKFANILLRPESHFDHSNENFFTHHP